MWSATSNRRPPNPRSASGKSIPTDALPTGARFLFGLALLPVLGPFVAAGAGAEKTPDFERLWARAVLIEETARPVIRRLAVTGRLHFDYAHLHSESGEEIDGWRFRRTRLGFRLGLFEHWELKTETDFDLNDADPAYLRLTDAHLIWTPSENLTVRIGKQPTRFTLEGSTSANQLITMDRSSFTSSLWFPRSLMPGVSVEQTSGPWTAFAGVYSAGSKSPEFGNFDGSAYGLFKISRDFSAALGCDEASLALHYVYQKPDVNNTFVPQHEQVGSVNFRFRDGRWGLQSEVAASRGFYAQPDLVGFLVMPFYDLNERWQIVARASWVRGDGQGGVRLPLVYEWETVGGLYGDRANDFYFGINRYFYGHQLKWQAGIEHTRMTGLSTNAPDYDALGITTGVRISW